MAFYKVSFSSDSIEGVTSLAELPAKSAGRDSVLPLGETAPPPTPQLQAAVGSGDSGLIIQGTSPPPMPASQGAADSNTAGSTGAVLPPQPDLLTQGDPVTAPSDRGTPPDPGPVSSLKSDVKPKISQARKTKARSSKT